MTAGGDDNGATTVVPRRRMPPEQDPIHALGLWLMQGGDGIPRQATGLRLMNKSEGGETITYWDLEYVQRNVECGLPETIYAILQSSCDDAGRPTVFYAQYVRGPEQQPWISKRIRLVPTDWNSSKDFDGSQQSLVVQAQKNAQESHDALIKMSLRQQSESSQFTRLLMEENQQKTLAIAKKDAKIERLQAELNEVRECLMALESDVSNAQDVDPKDMIEKVVKAVSAAKEMAGVVGMMTGAGVKLPPAPNGKAHA